MHSDKGSVITEILIGVAVILLVTLLVYPKFMDLIRKSSEATTRYNLKAIRNAVAIYYGDNEGRFPADITKELTADDGKYIKEIPELYCPPYHNITTAVTTKPTGDSGKWAYQTEETEEHQIGEVWIDCNHKDSNGVVWNTY